MRWNQGAAWLDVTITVRVTAVIVMSTSRYIPISILPGSPMGAVLPAALMEVDLQEVIPVVPMEADLPAVIPEVLIKAVHPAAVRDRPQGAPVEATAVDPL